MARPAALWYSRARMTRQRQTGLVLIAMLLVITGALQAQAGADNKGFITVRDILVRSCSACHDWTDSYEAITDPSRIVAGSPEKSDLYLKIADDTMPMKGAKLTSLEKALIKSWIAAGAPSSDAPVPVAEQGAAPAGAAVGQAAQAAPSSSFLGFPNKVVFHEVTGFTSAALFLAAGVIGVVHFVDMMNEGHAWRDANNWQEGSPESIRSAEISTVWGDNQALRWWHIGLLSAGEALYLTDAAVGISMWSKDTPGFTPQKLHKIAFFTHASLMVAQIILGFASTYAMETGQHDLMIGLGAAHAGIGLAIPLVMIGAGVANIVLLQ